MKLLNSLLLITTIFTLTAFQASSAIDDTLVSGKFGSDVVNAVKHIIQKSEVFQADDHRFFIRTAYAETRYANPIATGGIWKLSPQAFTATQSPTEFPVLKDLHAAIEEKFGINWMTLPYAQLGIPLYSGLAFKLFLETRAEPIPFTINAQAEYWKRNYNFESTTTPSTFVIAVSDLEEDPTCHGKLDLVIVLDGSASTAVFFEDTKDIILEMLNGFTLGSVRIGLVLYGGPNVTSYPLTDSQSEIVTLLEDLVSEAGEDTIGDGINAAVEILTASSSRQGAPHVMAIFTDGGGNIDEITAAVSNAADNKVTPYVLGVGNNTDYWQENLLAAAGGVKERLFLLTDDRDGALDEVTFQLNEQLCGVSQHREIQSGDELNANETRYYNFEMFNATGLTLIANVQLGTLTGYWSDTIENPSSAFYNGNWTLSSATPFVVPAAAVVDVDPRTIYVAVRAGPAMSNKYTLFGIATK